MLIRRMTGAEVPKVAELEQQVFTMPWSEQGFYDTLDMEHVLFLVAVEGETVCGYCGIYLAADEGEITNVAVAPLFRRKGTGRRLMEYLLKKAPSCGIGDCTLEVRAGNSPAISLYESLGFRTEGIRPGFYEKPREDALIMWKRQEEQG